MRNLASVYKWGQCRRGLTRRREFWHYFWIMKTDYKNNVHFSLIRISKIIAKNVDKQSEWEFCRDVLNNLGKGLNYGMPYKNNFKKQMQEDRDDRKIKKHNFKLITLEGIIDRRKKTKETGTFKCKN